MDMMDLELNDLIAKGKAQGYLTYDEVNAYLPDEDVNPEKLDNLLVALEEQGIELLEEAPDLALEEAADRAAAEAPADEIFSLELQPLNGQAVSAVNGAAPPGDPAPAPQPQLKIEEAKWSDDPIRMYLSQMAEIPLLTRDEEISLAKKIEVTRKRFRRNVLRLRLRAAKRRSRRWSSVHQRRAAVRSHDQGLAHRAADEGAGPGPHAAQPADARSSCWMQNRARLRSC